jgi:hypothetical protein
MIVYPTESYNSWISLADAITYFEGRLHSDEFTGAVTATQEAALITAFRGLNEFSFSIEYDDDDVIDTDYYTAAQIADILQALQYAQCEQALYELKLDLDQQFSQLDIPDLKMRKKEMPRYSPRVLKLIGPYIYAPTITVTR